MFTTTKIFTLFLTSAAAPLITETRAMELAAFCGAMSRYLCLCRCFCMEESVSTFWEHIKYQIARNIRNESSAKLTQSAEEDKDKKEKSDRLSHV